MEERLVFDCSGGFGIDVPNKGMGRAILGAWKTQHQGPGHKIKEKKTNEGTSTP